MMPSDVRSALGDSKEATETFERFASHLADNKVDLEKDKIQFGPRAQDRRQERELPRQRQGQRHAHPRVPRAVRRAARRTGVMRKIELEGISKALRNRKRRLPLAVLQPLLSLTYLGLAGRRHRSISSPNRSVLPAFEVGALCLQPVKAVQSVVSIHQADF